MLDPARRLSLPNLRHLQVYEDHEAPYTYYVVPTSPALAVEDDGKPTLRVLVYVKRSGTTKTETGGQLTLTTVLETAPDDLARVKRAIEAAVRKRSPSGPSAATPVRLVNPDWASGAVEVLLTRSLTVRGQPSLFAGNHCAMTAALNAEQARELRDQWKRKLADARITYKMEMRVASTSTGTAQGTGQATRTIPTGSIDVSRTVTIDVRAMRAVNQPITVEGPLWTSGLERLMTEIDLSR